MPAPPFGCCLCKQDGTIRPPEAQQPGLHGVTGTLVFSNIEGEPLRPRNLTKAWDRARTAMKLPPISFHAFRHTDVSLLIAKGVDILTISRRLGHASDPTTSR